MPQVLGDSGPAVLLLPGGAEAVAGFFPGLIEGLQADPGCRVILYDRPGTGTNSIRGGLAEAVEAIHSTLAELDLGPVVIIGQSLGGAVALLVARDHPEDVAGLVLLDPTPVNDVKLARRVERTARITGRLSKVPGLGRLLRAMLQSSAEKSVRRHSMGPETSAAMRKIADVDLVTLGESAAGLETIAKGFHETQLAMVPAAVVTADRKDKSPVRKAHQRLATALGVPLQSWPTAEHGVHLSHPTEVLVASREVVRKVASGG
ncbi:alpha/beta hydrolase [Microbacterium sp.]|uniref:alpha/beta fold hydrolase n=1 Tax=Microbacterium sp. TaxID=51671 RepID=UPI002E2F1156|nr:alpha/beta hydrolase [Microbacterium sp.]HEX5727833.1 alpha/beta hydrolase [Microbacterium sp.]